LHVGHLLKLRRTGDEAVRVLPGEVVGLVDDAVEPVFRFSWTIGVDVEVPEVVPLEVLLVLVLPKLIYRSFSMTVTNGP
jgi:hypothetical protein